MYKNFCVSFSVLFSYFFLLVHFSNLSDFRLPVHLGLEPPCPPMSCGLLTCLLCPQFSPECSPLPHSAAPREAHISPPPPSPSAVAVQHFCFPPTFSVAMETERQFWKEGESWSKVTAGLGVGGSWWAAGMGGGKEERRENSGSEPSQLLMEKGTSPLPP